MTGGARPKECLPVTSTEPYTTAATQARQATEKSIEAWRNGAKTFTDQLDKVTIPTINLTEPVTRYFEYLQRAVDFNRDLATRWAELVTTLSGSVREQATKVTSIVTDQTNTIADLGSRGCAPGRTRSLRCFTTPGSLRTGRITWPSPANRRRPPTRTRVGTR